MKISVITPVYNNADTLSACLNSVISQTYSNVELIIIDGGSSDGSLDVIRQYKNSISVVVSEPDDGIYDAFNKGINRSTGDVIGFLSADDFLKDSNVLTKIAEKFSFEMADVVYGDLYYVNKNDTTKVIRHWQAKKFSINQLAMGWMPPHPTLYIKASLYKELGAFDKTFRISGDYDFILRLFTRINLNIIYISEVLVVMRLGGVSNRSLKSLIQKSKEDYFALRKNEVGGLLALFYKNASKIPQFFLSTRHK